MSHVPVILFATAVGVMARLSMLRVDYRQYPSYPQGYAIHLSIGFIASLLGAVLIPALLEMEFTATTFLAVAASQFREVRSLERESLMAIDSAELVPRGAAYIEGIARVFEARNYLAAWTAVATAGSFYLTISFWGTKGKPNALDTNQIIIALAVALVGGLLMTMLIKRAMKGQSLGDIADVKQAEIEFDGPILTVEGVTITNIGLPESRQIYKNKGLAVTIRPKGPNAKATLGNLGQRQAIVHNAAVLLGLQKDKDTPEFTPVVSRDPVDGRLVLALVLAEKNVAALIEAVERVPVLEGAVRKPLQSVPGQMVR